jgi:hypothetical protein
MLFQYKFCYRNFTYSESYYDIWTSINFILIFVSISEMVNQLLKVIAMLNVDSCNYMYAAPCISQGNTRIDKGTYRGEISLAEIRS